MRISLIISVLLRSFIFVKPEVFFNYSLLGMDAYFEFNFEELDNNELRINGKSSYTDEWDTIIIKKEWIAWNNFAKR